MENEHESLFEIELVLTDLVAYLVVVVPELAAVGSLAPALRGLVESSTIRILDAVLLVSADDGTVTVHELPDEEFGDIEMERELGGLLSERDMELVSLVVRPGSAGLVLVTEDRWAGLLSEAARRAGGAVVGGERIPASRVEQALREALESQEGA